MQNPDIDVDALRRELEQAIDGEVRFDTISRALYSTDASVYQIQPAGVVVVRSREDVIRLVDICSKYGCPLTMRGGGTSQAGQTVGSGVIVDTSKYFNRILEVNAAERWARIEPGIVPAWAPRTFERRFSGNHQRLASPKRVAVFNDTFTNYYRPEIGVAGVDILCSAGFEVELAPLACCGRPLISQGLLDAARRQAAVTTNRLYSLVGHGVPIVFFEPSCFSSVREDLPSLLRGDAQRQARLVADRSMLFEEFLENEAQTPAARLHLRSGPSRILLHGHCHQKAMGRLGPAKALLSRIPGSTVVDLDAGCCGMAGSFGYVRDHFEVSRAIGERRLFPAARALGDDGVLVASGTSCRHQIADFTGVRALHPAELIRSLLREPA
jgi:Fe-S oxidoreductase